MLTKPFCRIWMFTPSWDSWGFWNCACHNSQLCNVKDTSLHIVEARDHLRRMSSMGAPESQKRRHDSNWASHPEQNQGGFCTQGSCSPLGLRHWQNQRQADAWTNCSKATFFHKLLQQITATNNESSISFLRKIGAVASFQSRRHRGRCADRPDN